MSGLGSRDYITHEIHTRPDKKGRQDGRTDAERREAGTKPRAGNNKGPTAMSYTAVGGAWAAVLGGRGRLRVNRVNHANKRNNMLSYERAPNSAC